MREGTIRRVKRRMLAAAVADNVDVIRGALPRAVRPSHVLWRMWVRRAPLLLVLLTFAASSYVISHTGEPPAAPSPEPVERAPSTGSTLLFAAPAPPARERVTASAFPLAVRRVVLDAGHGGSDPGATAAELLEKEITLDVGRRLRDRLESSGFEVVLTRDSDRTIALKDRALLANASRSDIFVSIHVNAIIKHTESRGVETYYLGATSDPSLTALAAAENRVSGYSIADMRKLLDGVYADARRDESRQLADAVQKSLYRHLSADDPALENWGVKRAPFIVLVATDMPAVLAEVGCISNEKEAAMLRRPEYRQKIANALYDGIRAYAGGPVTLQSESPQKKGSEQNG